MSMEEETNFPKQTEANELFVDWEDLVLHYKVFGSGKNVILCFHGHGKNADDFRFLSSPERRIISVNLFLHGRSTFDESRLNNNLLLPEDVEKLLEKLFLKEKIRQFHWVAYSQGGRFVLSLLPSFGSRIKSIQLLAPDGMNDKNFYSWTQRRWWARKLFKRWTERPEELLKISKVLAKRKVIRPKIVDFLNHYTSDKDKMKLAFQTWAGFRKFRPSPEKIRRTLENHSIPFRVIVGEYDQIITAESASNFLKKISREDKLVRIPFGHDFFRPEVTEKLKKILFFPD